MTTKKDEYDLEHVWQNEVRQLLHPQRLKGQKVSLRFALDRLRNRWGDTDKELAMWAHRERLSKFGVSLSIAAATCSAVAWLIAGSGGGASHVRDGLGFSIASLIYIGGAAGLYCVKRRCEREVRARTPLYVLDVSSHLLELTNHFGVVKRYVTNVGNLYNEFRGADYDIACVLSGTKPKRPDNSIHPELRKMALWRLLDMQHS